MKLLSELRKARGPLFYLRYGYKVPISILLTCLTLLIKYMRDALGLCIRSGLYSHSELLEVAICAPQVTTSTKSKEEETVSKIMNSPKTEPHFDARFLDSIARYPSESNCRLLSAFISDKREVLLVAGSRMPSSGIRSVSELSQ